MSTKGYPKNQKNVGEALGEDKSPGVGLKNYGKDISKTIGPNEQLYKNTIDDIIKKLDSNPNEIIKITPECLKIIVENAPDDKDIFRYDCVTELYQWFREDDKTGEFKLTDPHDSKGKVYSGDTKRQAAAAYFQERGGYVFESVKSVLSYLNNYLKENGLSMVYELSKSKHFNKNFMVEVWFHDQLLQAFGNSLYDVLCESIENVKRAVDDYEHMKKDVNSIQE